MTSTDALGQIVDHIERQGGGHLTLVLDEAGDWSAAYVFGQEADDSPMAGGASYGYGASAGEALDQIVQECRLA